MSDHIGIVIMMYPLDKGLWESIVACSDGPTAMLSGRTYDDATRAADHALREILYDAPYDRAEIWTLRTSRQAAEQMQHNGLRALFVQLAQLPADLVTVEHRFEDLGQGGPTQ
jgi:hypothetical protein